MFLKGRKCHIMFNVGMPELILILIIALIVFGPGKLPDISKALGKSIREFRKATTLDEPEVKNDSTPKETKPDDKPKS
jgi:sec-independent protein translocase protein TatA